MLVLLFWSGQAQSQIIYISTLVGNGTSGYSGENTPATSSSISNPWVLKLADENASGYYVTSPTGNRIYYISASTTKMITFAGNGLNGERVTSSK